MITGKPSRRESNETKEKLLKIFNKEVENPERYDIVYAPSMKKKLFNKEWISHILGFNMRTKDIILIQLDNEAKEVQDKVLSAEEKEHIITCRPADLIPNELPKIEEEMKQEVKKSMMYEETREVNDDLEFLKYLYKTDTDLYIMLLQDNYLESALKEKGYDDVTIKDFVNYVKDDINGVKPLVRVK